MKFAYDADVDALYITVADGNVYQSMAIDENTNVDVTANQDLVGIEVLSPSRYWPLAEIIGRWELSPADASMLMHMYPWVCSVSLARAAVVSILGR